MDGRWEAEQQRIRRAQETARKNRDELLTPAAVAALFGKSASTIRAAKHRGRIRPRLILALHRDVSLYRLDDCKSVWGEPKDVSLLERMRREGHTLGHSSVVFNVLNPTRLMDLRDPAEMEGES